MKIQLRNKESNFIQLRNSQLKAARCELRAAVRAPRRRARDQLSAPIDFAPGPLAPAAAGDGRRNPDVSSLTSFLRLTQICLACPPDCASRRFASSR